MKCSEQRVLITTVIHQQRHSGDLGSEMPLMALVCLFHTFYFQINSKKKLCASQSCKWTFIMVERNCSVSQLVVFVVLRFIQTSRLISDHVWVVFL